MYLKDSVCVVQEKGWEFEGRLEINTLSLRVRESTLFLLATCYRAFIIRRRSFPLLSLLLLFLLFFILLQKLQSHSTFEIMG